MTELTGKDKEALAVLYESEGYKALKKHMEIERFNIATKLLVWPLTDLVQVAKFQGEAESLKALNLELKRIHKEMAKD